MRSNRIFSNLIAYLVIVVVSHSLQVEARCSYEQLGQCSVRELYDMGMRYGATNQQTDSAFLCFSTIAGRHHDGMPEKDKYVCIDALTRLFAIYYTVYFDYGNAYECLCRADAIRRELGAEIPSLDICYGNIYSAIAGSDGDTVVIRRAIDNYRKAFWAAAKTDDKEILHIAFDNLALSAYGISEFPGIENEAVKYAELSTGDVDFQFFFNQWAGMKAIGEGRYADALACFRKQLEVSEGNVLFRRSNVNTLENFYTAYLRLGDMENAARMLDSMEMCARRFEMKDVLVNVYRLRADFCGHTGDSYGQMRFSNCFLSLRDSLISYQRLMSIEESDFLGRLKEAQEHIDRENERSRRRDMIIGFLIVLIGIGTLFFFILYNRNKRLKEKNRILYTKQNDYITETTHLYGIIRELQSTANDGNDSAAEEVRKYKNSALSDEDKKKIMGRIRLLLTDCDEIFSSEFSVGRLSELTGIKQRDVSQVINEMTGANFYVLINEFRIKEACRRMADTEHYGCLTLEGIATGVGFKSRSSFISFFKRFTGLTPSEYLDISRGKKA